MQNIINADLKESIEVKTEVLKSLTPKIEATAMLLISTLKNGKKILICGNGGSAADSQHFAAELIGRFKKDRPSLPAIALTTDSSIITAVGNDYGFEQIFSKQVEGLGNEGDVLIGISTSGESKNIIEAIGCAKQKQLKTIGLLGCSGGKISEIVDISLIVPSKNTPRIQEAHSTIIHILCNLIELELFCK